MAIAEAKIEGLEIVLKRLSPDLYAKPLGRFWDRSALRFLREAKMRSPWDTGRLRSSLAKGTPEGIWEKDSASPPIWMKVGTNVRHGDFYYPRALEESEKYHYRGGKAAGRPHPKAKGRGGAFAQQLSLLGQPTKGWFSGALALAGPGIQKEIDTMKAEIAANWSKK